MNFVFVSGNAALDFVGTLKWRRSHSEELLTDPKAVVRWAQEADLITAPFTVSTDEFDDLIAFRETIYRMLSAALAGGPVKPSDIGQLNDKLQAPGPRLRFEGGSMTRTGNAANLAAALGVATAELLAGEETSKLKECGRQDCTRIFIDRSRSGTRTWCGMEECGNRIKAANYRRRKAQKIAHER